MELAERCLKDFFKSLRRIKSQWESLVYNVDRPLAALKNQTEQLQLISCANLDTEFTTLFPEIKERLTGKIILGIEEEMKSLRKILVRPSTKQLPKSGIFTLGQIALVANILKCITICKEICCRENMSVCTEELKSKYLAVEQAYYKMNTEEKEEFNPLRLPLSDLLEYAVDAFRLYQASFVSKQISLETADYMDSQSIIRIERAFIEDRLKKDHIQLTMALADIKIPTSTPFAIAVTISCVIALIVAYHNYKLSLDEWENHVTDDDITTNSTT